MDLENKLLIWIRLSFVLLCNVRISRWVVAIYSSSRTSRTRCRGKCHSRSTDLGWDSTWTLTKCWISLTWKYKSKELVNFFWYWFLHIREIVEGLYFHSYNDKMKIWHLLRYKCPFSMNFFGDKNVGTTYLPNKFHLYRWINNLNVIANKQKNDSQTNKHTD